MAYCVKNVDPNLIMEFISIVDMYIYLLDCICVTKLSLKKSKLTELVWQDPESPKQLNCLLFTELPYQEP